MKNNGLVFGFILLFLSCKEDKMFTALEPSQTKIDFVNKLERKEGFSILYYLYFYNGGGVATGDINNDGLPDIYFTANTPGNNKLYLNKGDFIFEDITQNAGVGGNSDWCSGVTMADVNGDDYLDIYVSAITNTLGLQGRNQLFINNKNGTFTDRASEYGLDFAGWSAQAAFFDFDHDGDLDCYLLNQSHKPNENLVDTSLRKKFDPLAGDRFYRNDLNDSAKKFVDISREAGIYQSSLGYGLGLAVADLNNDGWDDIYVGNDFHENDYYYINNGNGSFSESGAAHFKHYSRFSMGNDIADYDNDGQLDVLTVDMLPSEEKVLKTYGSDERIDVYDYKITGHGYQHQYSRNCLQHNNGDGESFSDVGLAAGIAATDWSWSALMNDFDNDGNKDIFITSGIVRRPVDLDYIKYVSDLAQKQSRLQTNEYDDLAFQKSPDGSSHCYIYIGNGEGAFQDRSTEWGFAMQKGYFNGAAYADLDNDGDLDIVVNALNGPALVKRNNQKGKNYLSIAFDGEEANRKGIGTKVYIFNKGKMQYQQLMLTRGFQSSVEARLHFGLDTATVLDSLLIVWPDKKQQLLKNVKTNQRLTIHQSEARADFVYPLSAAHDQGRWVNLLSAPGWKHRENRFTDFNYQYLIPHQQSARGPAVAVADVNGDKLNDMFVCGARGQSAALLLQTEDGRMAMGDTALFVRNRQSEGVACAFFDADSDGDMDLYVATGGNELPDGSPELADHLYINNGKGQFSEWESAIPELYYNKSTVSAADVDQDGDIDLFVGVLADARQYGYPKTSFLLLNDGKGIFTAAPEKRFNGKNIGLVTSSAFADIDNNGWPDLVVSGEWMPVKIFMNTGGNFSAVDIPKSTGLWQSLYPADVNADGHIDLLAGNWGQNTKLWSGKNGPVKLYVKDFDRNGSVEQILCYTIDGKEYTFLPKDELEQTLPVLKKAYLSYGEVAGKTVQYLFDDLFPGNLELKAELLSSSCFMGDGKGNFQIIELPVALQLAPIFTFNRMGADRFVAGGNFYGVLPYEGRYDALDLTSFRYNSSTGAFSAIATFPDAPGEIRSTAMLNDSVLVVARNNREPLFLKVK